MQSRAYTVYMMASASRVLYTGVSGHLVARVWKHKTHAISGFTDRYCCDRLVWSELHTSPQEAIAREKQIKGWARRKKIALIEAENPEWRDLAEHLWPAELILEERRKNGDLRVR